MLISLPIVCLNQSIPTNLRGPMSRVIIAPDSFKGTATNVEVARWIAQGWRLIRPSDDILEIPMADGGEGTLLAIAVRRSDVEWQTIDLIDLGRRNSAKWILLPEGTAIVELAQGSGITLQSEMDPLGAHTFGFGKILRAAASDPRVKKIYCALGGSGSTDAGVGALHALGFKFFDKGSDQIALGGGALSELDHISAEEAVPLPPLGVVVMVDTNSPLLGNKGSANVFGPQKGATKLEIEILEKNLSHLVQIVGKADLQGDGAAGGTAYGLTKMWGASISNGAPAIAEITGLNSEILTADYLITGEGRLDTQSFDGKIVGYLSELAKELRIPVGYCVGSRTIDFPDNAFCSLTLEEIAGSKELGMLNVEQHLLKAGAEMARSLIRA